MENPRKILLYGYGNPGRQDDGLGIEFIDCIQQWIKEEKLELSVQLDSNYHLNVEDVEAIADKDLVIFIDASKENICDFYLSKVDPSTDMAFSMHSVSPGYLLNLSEELYHRKPMAYLLHIRGYKWDINGKLTAKAQKNLCKAINYIKEKVRDPEPLISARYAQCSIDIKKILK